MRSKHPQGCVVRCACAWLSHPFTHRLCPVCPTLAQCEAHYQRKCSVVGHLPSSSVASRPLVDPPRGGTRVDVRCRRPPRQFPGEYFGPPPCQPSLSVFPVSARNNLPSTAFTVRGHFGRIIGVSVDVDRVGQSSLSVFSVSSSKRRTSKRRLGYCLAALDAADLTPQ